MTNQNNIHTLDGLACQTIVLYGPPGSGKSAVGRVLAQQLDCPFTDLDDEIEARSGKGIPQIFAEDGEPVFREIERKVLADLLRGSPLQVIALGGGALTQAATRQLAEGAAQVICLTASPERLYQRLATDAIQRPLLAEDLAGKLATLLNQRGEHYASFPIQVDTNERSPIEAAHECQIALGHYRVSGMGPDYDVIVRQSGLVALGGEMAARELRGPVALAVDDNVAGWYQAATLQSLRQAGYQAEAVSFPAGESAKTIHTVTDLWTAFLRLGLERSSTVLALGGGVTTDLAGFAAATYQRGVRWVSAPTSLLGMVDAGFGGKTGIDLPEGKNLAGAFHAPALVWIDPSVLATLPEEEIRNGMAEVVKHGVIADPILFRLTGQGIPQTAAGWRDLVARAVGVKARIINVDPFEKGLRASLNLGHTIGHGVETASRFTLRHGEAVAIGTILEARLAERIGLADAGLTEAIRGTLARLGLPTAIPAGLDRSVILNAMTYDKKRSGGKLRFALPVRIGEVRIGVTIDPQDLEAILAE